MDFSKLKIGFIGAGNIAQAIVKGFLKSKQIKPEQISVSAPSDKNLKIFKDLNCVTYNDNSYLFSHCRSLVGKFYYILFICVKPNITKNVMLWNSLDTINLTINETSYSRLIIISVMAGVKISFIYRQLFHVNQVGDPILVTRIMPNTACSINFGSLGLCFDTIILNPTYEEKSLLFDLIQILGLVEVVNEEQMDAVCAVSGSGIAFAYSMIQSMADGAVFSGLSRSAALNLATQTILGACKMVQETGKNPIELRDMVCSPSGTTINGIRCLEQGNFNASVMNAVISASQRSKELSQ